MADDSPPPTGARAIKAQSGRGRSQYAGPRRALTPVNNVLSEVVKNLGLDKRLQERALLDLWPAVCGELFADKSRALFLDSEGNIVISVKDASVGQELSLRKTEMLQKLKPFCRTLSVTVRGMRFDLKHFHSSQSQESGGPTPSLARAPMATPEELAALSLTAGDANQLELLQTSLSSQSVTNPETTNRVTALYERELRMKIWRRLQGFPTCPQCGEPTEAMHSEERLCRDCYFYALSHKRDI